MKQRKDIVTDLDNCYTTTYSIQPLHSQARRPLGRLKLPFGVDDCWETYPSALTDTILRLTPIFATLFNLVLYSVDEAIRVCEESTVEHFHNYFNLLRGHWTLLPYNFLPLLRHYAFLLRKNVGNHSNCERSLPTKHS